MMSFLNDNRKGSSPGRLGRRAMAARLLLRNLGRTTPGIPPERRSSPQGPSYDLYETSPKVRKTVVMVYGFTLAGEKEPRLVKFAQTFTASGFRVVVPELSGLKALTLERSDLDRLVHLICHLQEESGATIGLVGFSAGGGIALAAAADPRVRGWVDPILLFGPHYSLPDLWAGPWRSETPLPKTEEDWENFIWWQLVLAYRQGQTIGFPAPAQAEIEGLLKTYCVESSMARKKEIYERWVRPHGVLSLQNERVDKAVLEELSPCGKLALLPARVMILHDAHDALIPPTHSRRILAELQQRKNPHHERLLVTPLFSHVTPRAIFQWADLFTLLDMFGELFSGPS